MTRILITREVRRDRNVRQLTLSLVGTWAEERRSTKAISEAWLWFGPLFFTDEQISTWRRMVLIGRWNDRRFERRMRDEASDAKGAIHESA